jgi:putative heme iron utilization protein
MPSPTSDPTPDPAVSLRSLLASSRVAALAASSPDGPVSAMVALAFSTDFRHAFLHLSSLSSHKKLLLLNPLCSLLVHDPDDGRPQPLLLRRAALTGTASLIPKDSPDFPAASSRYLDQLPASRLMFSLPDFDLFRIDLHEIRYVEGFGRAFSFSPDQWTISPPQ